MKRILFLVLAMMMALVPAVTAEEEVAFVDDMGLEVENPIYHVESLEELRQELPQITLPDLPKMATGEVFCVGHTDAFDFAQIQFAWGEDFFNLRAAQLPADGNPIDIDGLYLAFDKEETFTNLFEGETDALLVRSSTTEAYVACYWVHDGIQYSLFSETAGEPEMTAIEVAAELMEKLDVGEVSDDE